MPHVSHVGPERHDIPPGGRLGFVMADDRQVHYLEWGPSAAPTIVCLHGGGQTAYMYEDLGTALGTRYHVVAPDLPGHGESEPLPDEPFNRQVLARTLPPLLEEFGIRRAVFVGASLGGIAGLTLAAMRQDLVTALVLIDVGHRLEDEGVNRIIDFLGRHESFGSLEEAAVAIAEYLPHREGAVDPQRLRRNLRQRPDGAWVWKHNLGRSVRERGSTFGGWRALMAGMEDEASGITCPVLVLRGAGGDALSDEGADEVAALLPDARLQTIGAAGHHAAGDNPATTVSLVRAFLDEIAW